jgi:hypothetical protein
MRVLHEVASDISAVQCAAQLPIRLGKPDGKPASIPTYSL